MSKIKNNYAFIDSQNLNLSTLSQGFKLDYRRFRTYLKDKYNVTKAFIFIGYIKGNEGLYKELQENGYICIFKPTLELPDGKTKGNVDAELVLHTMILLNNFDKAVIVSGDGDFYCLVKYLIEKEKLLILFAPNRKKYSGLYKRKEFFKYIRFVGDIKNKAQKKKDPDKDRTL
jgi:uncharacterized LabA/DUF88 family protein